MTATALPDGNALSGAPARLARAVRTETGLFRLAIAVIALHLIDDNFIQPSAGTSAADHLVSGLVPLAVLGLAAWAHPRLVGFVRGGLAVALGVLAIGVGVPAAHYANQVGASGSDYTGLLAFPAAALLLGLGAATLWRTRRTTGNLAWRYGRRALLTFAFVLAAGTIVWPIGLGYVTTHVSRAIVPENELGVAYEDVQFETSDGLTLHGWYVPSRNGAAVIATSGRKNPQRPARMLARHGYGVLLFDRRGEGVSDGDPNTWGWGGDRDIKAAIDYLQHRPDVDPERIGGIGMSVGGEMMIETAAETDELKAVVSDGAGARSYREEFDLARDANPVDKVLGAVLLRVKSASTAVFSNEPPPPHLKDLAAKVAPRPLMLIAAPNSGAGEELNRDYHEAAGPTSTLWEVPEAGHMGAAKVRPAEYERRIVGFFDGALQAR
jgi:hypothetical protein